MIDPAARERTYEFLGARNAWRHAQRTLAQPISDALDPEERTLLSAQHTKEYVTARQQFEAARDAIRLHDNPDFLAPLLTIDAIAASVLAADAALVYLCAGLKGDAGFTIIVTRTSAGDAQTTAVALPSLTGDALSALRETHAPDDTRPTGGFAQAQMGWAFGHLRDWGTSAQDCLTNLPPTSGFAVALLRLQAAWTHHPSSAALLSTSYEQLTANQLSALDNAFTQILLEIELERVTSTLGTLGLDSLAAELATLGIRQVALVPYGMLALLPLLATTITTQAGSFCFGDLFETTIAPSARALTVTRERAQEAEIARQNGTRSAVLAVGNPLPLPWGRDLQHPQSYLGNLAYAQAEADSARRLATTTFSYHPDQVFCYTLETATRQNLMGVLPYAWYAHLATHGTYEQANPRQSRLILSGDAQMLLEQRTLTLGEMLDGTVDLRGLRLVVLSACETNIIAHDAADEVVGLASGMQQAGAAGVIASLWAVDDRATYLLMVRFMQYWLDPERRWSPARCLAAAQRWLREKATYRVLQRYDPLVKIPLDEDAPLPDSATIPTISRQQTREHHESEPELVGARRRSTRYTQTEVWEYIHEMALDSDPDALPYAHPYYWSAFTVTGI
jgi:CHAT domain-containing protein